MFKYIQLTAFVFLAVFLLCGSCKTRVHYNSRVKHEYEDSFQQMPAGFKNDNTFENGALIMKYLDYKEDTLNKQRNKASNVKIANEGYTHRISGARKQTEDNTYIPMMYGSYNVKGDTLILQFDDAFHNLRIIHKLAGNIVTSFYQQFEENPNKASLGHTLADNVIIASETKMFEISNKVRYGTLFGKAQITTKPFYVVNNSYKGGFLKKRISMKYLFKLNKADCLKK